MGWLQSSTKTSSRFSMIATYLVAEQGFYLYFIIVVERKDIN